MAKRKKTPDSDRKKFDAISVSIATGDRKKLRSALDCLPDPPRSLAEGFRWAMNEFLNIRGADFSLEPVATVASRAREVE